MKIRLVFDVEQVTDSPVRGISARVGCRMNGWQDPRVFLLQDGRPVNLGPVRIRSRGTHFEFEIETSVPNPAVALRKAA